MVKFIKSKLAVTAVAMAVVVVTVPPAVVKAAENVAGVSVDEVVVVGYRGQTRDAIQRKREAEGVADFLSIDDLNQVPDPNIADSLQRLPGVLSILGTDEGRYVALRGLDSTYTNVTIDGSMIAAIDRTQRRVVTDAIPPSAVTGLELYKTMTADQDGNAIGGAINLRTRSAFDKNDTFFVANVLMGDHDSQFLPAEDELSHNADFAYSDIFGASGEFGVVLFGSHFSKTRDESRSNRTNGFINDMPVVRNVIPLDYENEIDRYSFGGRLEYRPSDTFYAYVGGSVFNADYFVTRYNLRLDGNNGELTQNAGQGDFAVARARPSTNQFPFEQELSMLQAYAEYRPDFGGRFEFRASLSEGALNEKNYGMNFDAGTNAAFAYSYDFENPGSGGLAGLSYPDLAAINDPSNYLFSSYAELDSTMDEEVNEFQTDYSYNNEADAEGLGFATGLRYRELERTFDRTQAIYGYNGAEALTYDRFGYTNGYTPEKTPGLQQIFGDVDAFRAFFNANRADFSETGRMALNSARADYAINEEVTAAYFLGAHRTERYSLIGGLRYEQTDVATESFFNREGNFEIARRKADYNDLLPSLQFQYDLSEQLRLTLAYYRAVGRPNHTNLAQAESRDIAADGTIILTRANPDLEARRADNYDVALDWFVKDGVLVSLAVFQKELEDEIFNLIIDDTEAGTGLPVEIQQPVNISDATVKGVELGFTYDELDFLPYPLNGLGVSANFTWIEGEIAIPNLDGTIARVSDNTQEQPEYVANVALLYALGDFEARLSYSERGDYFFRLRQNPSQDRVELGFETWDFSARYRFNEHFAGTFEARNITDAFRSNSESGLVRSTSDWGGSVWLGFTYTY